MPRDAKLEASLLLIRLAAALFMLIWAVDKVVNVRHAQGVFASFYFWRDASPTILLVMGLLQIAVLIAFAVGFMRFWTYGAVVLMHTASTLSSLGKMIPPYGPSANLVFWAAVPTLAAIIALFLLRDRDRLLAVGH